MAHGSFGDVRVFDRKKWSDGLQIFEWKKNEWMPVRFYGPIYTDCRHNVKTKTNKVYYEYCLGYDTDNDDHFSDREERCPCCALRLPSQQRFYCNCIDMTEWERRPANPKPDWSPLRMMELPQTLVKHLKSLVQLNKGEQITDPAKGAIVNVKFNPDGDPATMYAANIEQKTWAIPEEIASLSVVQTLPDGRKVERKPSEGMPGAYIYYRIVNKKSDVEKGLQRHGYYGDVAATASSNTPAAAVTEEYGEMPQKSAKADPVARTAVETPVEAGADFDPKELVPANCPTEFGQFADEVVCFTKCKAKSWCKTATVKNQTTNAKPAKANKDDDDSV